MRSVSSPKVPKAESQPVNIRDTPALYSQSSQSTHLISLRSAGGCPCEGRCPRCQAQRTLPTTQPDEACEREASQVAEIVAQGNVPPPMQKKQFSESKSLPNPAEEKQEEVDVAEEPEAPKIFSTPFEPPPPNSPGPIGSKIGMPLDRSIRQNYERLLQCDLSQVRIHNDPEAADVTRRHGARALTYQNHIFFNQHAFTPETWHGRKLLAHELTHVVQQQPGGCDGAGELVRESMPLNLAGRELEEGPVPPEDTPAVPENSIEVDVMTAGGSFQDLQNQAAMENSSETNIDIVATNMRSMIEQLERLVGENRCLRRLTIHNHAYIHGQIVGPALIRERRAVYGHMDVRATEDAGTPEQEAAYQAIPYSEFDLDWLQAPSNQEYVNRLRRLFCRGAEMIWTGCSTLGTIAQGGIRTPEELLSTRSDRYSETSGANAYHDVSDAARHGATILGGEFGQINVQAWADALGVRVVAATDLVDWRDNPNPGGPRFLAHVGHGGEWQSVSPRTEATYDAATGRINNPAATAEEIRQRTSQERRELIELEPRADFIPAGFAAQWDEGIRNLAFYQAQQHNPESRLSRSPHRGQIQIQIAANVRRMIVLLARSITPPSPLPVLPHDAITPWVIPWMSSRFRAAVIPRLALSYPDNFWRWLVVNPGVIGNTPEYTYATLQHELQHAADILRYLQAYRQSHGDVPRLNPGDRRLPRGADDPGFSAIINQRQENLGQDEWGHYAREFIESFLAQLPPTRHHEIVLGEQQHGFAYWTDQEQISWIGGIFDTLPPHVPAGQPLSGEAEVNRLFNARPDFRPGIRNAFMVPFTRMASGERACGIAHTLLTHFQPIRDDLEPAELDFLTRQYQGYCSTRRE